VLLPQDGIVDAALQQMAGMGWEQAIAIESSEEEEEEEEVKEKGEAQQEEEEEEEEKKKEDVDEVEKVEGLDEEDNDERVEVGTEMHTDQVVGAAQPGCSAEEVAAASTDEGALRGSIDKWKDGKFGHGENTSNMTLPTESQVLR
jgi:hypothetical protein